MNSKHYHFWALANVLVTKIIDPWQWSKITWMTFTIRFFYLTLALLLCCILFPSMSLYYTWTNLIRHLDTNANCMNLFMTDSCFYQWQHITDNANTNISSLLMCVENLVEVSFIVLLIEYGMTLEEALESTRQLCTLWLNISNVNKKGRVKYWNIFFDLI